MRKYLWSIGLFIGISLHPFLAHATTVDFNSQAGGGGGNTTVDGWIGNLGGGVAWTFNRNAATATNVYVPDSNNAIASYTFSGPDSGVARWAATEDTSTLGSSAVIDSAKFCVYITAHDGSAGDSVRLSSVNLASNNDIVSSDFLFTNWGTTAYATDLVVSALTDNAFNCWDMNSTGIAAINKTGITALSLRMVTDSSNSAPPGGVNNYAQWDAVDNGSNIPFLEVVYHTAGGSSSSSSTPDTSTGSLQNSTGSIVGFHTSCETFDTFSGGEVCTQYDTSVSIPMVRFITDDLGYLMIATAFLFFAILLIYEWLAKVIWRWFWRLITGRHPEV